MLRFVKTEDGSLTLFNPEIGEHYHSSHGALQESRHVFLEMGLIHSLENNPGPVRILEVGFGTGLNFLLSADYCNANEISLNYTGIEAFPLSAEMISKTNYDEYIAAPLWEQFCSKYPEAFQEEVKLNALCHLKIEACKLEDFQTSRLADLVYFDAFASVSQPELWTLESISHLNQFIKPGGIFVTYAITGNLKRILKSLNYQIEKVPGAKGKREMLRGIKAES